MVNEKFIFWFRQSQGVSDGTGGRSNLSRSLWTSDGGSCPTNFEALAHKLQIAIEHPSCQEFMIPDSESELPVSSDCRKGING